jgi:hypothetical protein
VKFPVRGPVGPHGNRERRVEQVKFHQVYYVLDPQLRLLWIGGEWDEFAIANGGASARVNEVLSTSLRDHIADPHTSAAMVRLIEAVREAAAPLRIDYRCDSYTLQRRFQMTIQPMKEQRVLVVHDLRDARTFEVPHPPWRHTPMAEAGKCSFCCAVRWPDGTWQDAVALRAPHPETVAYAICPACAARVDEATSALRAKRKPKTSVTGGFGP